MALNHITNDIGIFAESLFLQNYRLHWGKYRQECEIICLKNNSCISLNLKQEDLDFSDLDKLNNRIKNLITFK